MPASGSPPPRTGCPPAAPLRVLVCGSNYGHAYVHAVREAPELYRLAGILGLGSPRSHRLAAQCGVPLYQSVEGVTSDIDLACAAMGSSGGDAVLQLLQRGIHVLCEHPLRPEFVEKALDVAASTAACFHVNAHFAALDAASALAERCRDLRRSLKPAFVGAVTTDRSLYGVLDILRRAFGSFDPFSLALVDRSGPFALVTGTLGGVPTTLQIQRSATADGVLPDGDPAYLVDHRITVGFATGVIALASIAGPVIWNRNCNLPSHPDAPMWTAIHDPCVSLLELQRQRTRANLEAIQCLVECSRTGTVPASQSRSHLLEVCSVWSTLGQYLR